LKGSSYSSNKKPQMFFQSHRKDIPFWCESLRLFSWHSLSLCFLFCFRPVPCVPRRWPFFGDEQDLSACPSGGLLIFSRSTPSSLQPGTITLPFTYCFLPFSRRVEHPTIFSIHPSFCLRSLPPVCLRVNLPPPSDSRPPQRAM